MTSSRRKAEPKPAAKRPSSARRQRTLLVVGPPQRARPVCKSLRRVKVELESLRWSAAVFARPDEATLGVVLLAPLADEPAWRAVEKLRREVKRPAFGVFVVLFDEADDADVRRLYEAGATAVFDWPTDALLISDLVAETLGAEQVRGKAAHSDQALTRMVRARLALAHSIPRRLRLHATDGVLQISGSVQTLWQRSLIGELVERIPGVRDVVTSGLTVPPSGIADREVLRAVKRAIDTLSTGAETVSATVEGGRVQLAGTMASRHELDDLLRAISDINGVRAIDNHLVVAPLQRDKDRKVAQRLRDLLKRLLPQVELELAVFSGIVVLRGAVPDLASKREAERAVANDADTVRIINKLFVR